MSESTRAEVTRKLLAVVTLKKRVGEVEADLRLAAAELFTKVGQREVGDVGDLGDLGTVQKDRGATYWSVGDPDALQAFVAERFPEQIETVPAFERVRPAYVSAVLAGAKSAGAAVTKDGELIPGIECSTSDAKLVVKTSADAGQVLAQAFADGLLSLDDLTTPLAIEAAQ